MEIMMYGFISTRSDQEWDSRLGMVVLAKYAMMGNSSRVRDVC